MPKIINNVVPKSEMNAIQLKILAELSSILSHSFGPLGSNTCIKRENALNEYTKDGHTILSAVQYNGVMEQSIKDDIESITRHIVKTVGDGTTSAVILSEIIFRQILAKMDVDKNVAPFQYIRTLQAAVDTLCDAIKDMGKPATPEDMYHITMISTNGNKYIADLILRIYQEYGMNVFIDVSASNGTEFVTKAYDGMTFDTGFYDTNYVTDPTKNVCEVPQPEIYLFEHPVDTAEMAVLLDGIIKRNIAEPYMDINTNPQSKAKILPTVIICPKISQDLSAYLSSINEMQSKLPAGNKLPFCLISNVTQGDQIMDIIDLCGGKPIRKYIDADLYKHDVEKGLAPTPDTVWQWAGSCEKAVISSSSSTFINPADKFNPDGSLSNKYNVLLNSLKSELKRAEDEGDDIRFQGNLKRRINSLESNMVDLMVGGITMADRDSLRALVEDAVKNCRSAAKEGVGFGANVNGLLASEATYRKCMEQLANTQEEVSGSDNLMISMISIINQAYIELERKLLSTLYGEGMVEQKIKQIFKSNLPINLNTGEPDENVKSSIMSDIIILQTVSKIVSIMVTCNQFMTPSAMHNVYVQ